MRNAKEDPAQVAGPGSSQSGGTYALLLRLDRQESLEVGRLGRFNFSEGFYLYVGSAMGGLKSRIRRYLGGSECLHWHIDYLAARCQLLEIWWRTGEDRFECAWASSAARRPGSRLPVPGFGSSDCRCASHLVWFPERPLPEILGTEGVSTLTLDGMLPVL